MGRPKNFSREEVLQKAIPLFWRRGFADTSLQDLEKATGVNKSGLYSEFASKEEIFAMDREIQDEVARATAAAQAAAFPPPEDAFAHIYAGGDLWPK